MLIWVISLLEWLHLRVQALNESNDKPDSVLSWPTQMRRSLLSGRDILFIEWLDDEIGLTAKYRFVSKAELSAKFIYINCHVIWLASYQATISMCMSFYSGFLWANWLNWTQIYHSFSRSELLINGGIISVVKLCYSSGLSPRSSIS